MAIAMSSKLLVGIKEDEDIAITILALAKSTALANGQGG